MNVWLFSGFWKNWLIINDSIWLSSFATILPFKSFSKKCIQYSERKIWMADVKLSNWNIATNAATERKKIQKLKNLIICVAKHWAKHTKLKHDFFYEYNMNRLELHFYYCDFFENFTTLCHYEFSTPTFLYNADIYEAKY